MHTYRKQDGLYIVGYWTPDGETAMWEPLKDFTREYDAAAYVSFLNGGSDATPLGAARFTELVR